ncbi:hypothetical protein GFM44_23405 [Rhizobium leguminosarum bv. viciae]|nr:hypothetical protein [Rhizobium leguminosarum bv. viciae]
MQSETGILRDIEQTPDVIRAWVDEVADYFFKHPVNVDQMNAICKAMKMPTTDNYHSVRKVIAAAMKRKEAPPERGRRRSRANGDGYYTRHVVENAVARAGLSIRRTT